MPQVSNPAVENYGLIIAIALIFFFLIVIKLIVIFVEFSHELKMINLEIERTSGSERRYWLRKRRKLWLSLFPFVKY